mmetsp:Transcript_145697/g.405985  ORF Transcript_145697/g.405985 Transcript_145697/m.405985 type:complete len:318 (-) Transcript_145697:36-989(-)
MYGHVERKAGLGVIHATCTLLGPPGAARAVVKLLLQGADGVRAQHLATHAEVPAGYLNQQRAHNTTPRRLQQGCIAVLGHGCFQETQHEGLDVRIQRTCVCTLCQSRQPGPEPCSRPRQATVPRKGGVVKVRTVRWAHELLHTVVQLLPQVAKSSPASPLDVVWPIGSFALDADSSTLAADSSFPTVGRAVLPLILGLCNAMVQCGVDDVPGVALILLVTIYSYLQPRVGELCPAEAKPPEILPRLLCSCARFQVKTAGTGGTGRRRPLEMLIQSGSAWTGLPHPFRSACPSMRAHHAQRSHLLPPHQGLQTGCCGP